MAHSCGRQDLIEVGACILDAREPRITAGGKIGIQVEPSISESS